MTVAEERIVKAAKAFCDATRGGDLGIRLPFIPSAIVHELFDATLADEAGKGDFPMLDGPSIPWSVAERIYVDLYVPCFGNTATLERFAERGGFAYGEVRAFAVTLHHKCAKT